jgi:hypothetical protein
MPDKKNRNSKHVLSFLGVLSMALAFNSGCSLLKQQIYQKAGNFMLTSLENIYQENDLKLAEQFLGSNIKLIEICAQNEPNNRTLNLLAAQAFGAYAMAFIEDQDPDRANQFYRRGLYYAFRALPPHIKFDQHIAPHALEPILQRCRKSDVPVLFWIGYNWGQSILRNIDQPAIVADLAKVELIMHRVLELDEYYNFGGVHLFYGNYYAARSPMIGGNPTLGQKHFERNLELTKHCFNLTKYYYARYYAVQMQDLPLFDSLLAEIIQTDLDEHPEIRLFNALAKQKALLLIKERDIYFDLELQNPEEK